MGAVGSLNANGGWWDSDLDVGNRHFQTWPGSKERVCFYSTLLRAFGPWEVV
jgi:hypothetical protein